MRTICVSIATLLLAAGNAAAQGCSVADIEIKSVRAKWANECRTSPCMYMRGIAVLKNNCREAVGVEVKVTGLDSAGEPVQTTEGWPASVRNIPPGEFEFSLDQWLQYDGDIKTFSVRPVRVKRWK